MLKEQWIRAKYERKEFTEPGTKVSYEDGKLSLCGSMRLRLPTCDVSRSCSLINHVAFGVSSTRTNDLRFPAETKDGMLMKRGRDNGQFLSRRFVLSEREGTLKYFAKIDVSSSFCHILSHRRGPRHQPGNKALGPGFYLLPKSGP